MWAYFLKNNILPGNYMPKPRESQIQLIDGIADSIRKGNKRIIACAPTGFGKSVTMAAIVKRAMAKNKRIVIVLPRRSLVFQLSKSFEKYRISHGVMMAGEPRLRHADCQIASIDTYLSWLGNGRINAIDADILMIDEMHTQFSPKKLELFAKYPLVIGFSATPVAPGKQSLGVFYDDIVESIPMRELIAQGLLSPLRYFSPTDFHPDNLKLDADGDYNEKALIKYVDDRLKGDDGKLSLVGDIYKNWQKLASDRKTVVFCSTQDHARFVTNEFIRKGIKAEYVDCNTPDDERKRIFDGMEHGNIQVICNVGIISMGIDIPNISCVVLARPTKLLSNYLQCVGRGTRIYEGKQDCIVIDHCGIVCTLGFAEDEQYWSLDGKETQEARKERVKGEKKEPKEIKCKNPECGHVFKSRRVCPACGFEMIKPGKPVPVHESEMKEVTKIEKVTPELKQDWYAQLLYIANQKGYQRGWADWSYHAKFGHFPKIKKGIQPQPAGDEVCGYVQHLAIKRAKAVA
jgi:DNA repair protein RadD